MKWISIDNELPIQKFDVYVKNANRIYLARYFRKKWYTHSQQLHKVTHWCISIYNPQYKHKSSNSFKKFTSKYRRICNLRKTVALEK